MAHKVTTEIRWVSYLKLWPNIFWLCTYVYQKWGTECDHEINPSIHMRILALLCLISSCLFFCFPGVFSGGEHIYVCLFVFVSVLQPSRSVRTCNLPRSAHPLLNSVPPFLISCSLLPSCLTWTFSLSSLLDFINLWNTSAVSSTDYIQVGPQLLNLWFFRFWFWFFDVEL